MTENEIAKIIVDAAFQIHKRLGPGLLETVYEVVLAYDLKKKGLKVVGLFTDNSLMLIVGTGKILSYRHTLNVLNFKKTEKIFKYY